HGQPKVGLKRALMAGFERLEPTHGREHRVLYEISSVLHPARGLGQPPSSPTSQWRNAALEELVEGRMIAVFHLLEQVDRRLRRQKVRVGFRRPSCVISHGPGQSRRLCEWSPAPASDNAGTS